MENPYQILRRFIKWEIMDLEAMVETIDSKNEMQRRKEHIEAKVSSNAKSINKLKEGKGFSLASKSSKVNRITDLTSKIEFNEKEIDCAAVLTRIIFLYL